MRWQPMSTAPKDGTRLIAVRADEPDSMEITEYCVIERHHYERVGDGLFRRVEDEPDKFWNGNGHRATHWMPLPPMPTDTGTTA